MKKIIRVIVCSTFVPTLLYSQANVDLKQRIKDFGLNTQQISSFTTNVNGAYDLVFEPTEIFYVNSSNQVCEFKKVSGVWTNVGVLNSSAPAVRTGGQIHRAGNKIYYVSQSNSKIYQLENTTGTTWTQTLLVSGQIAVRSDADILYSYPHVYYIGSNNYVCDIITLNGGASWQGGGALNTSSSLVRANSNIIQPLNTSIIYYIGTGNNVCELIFSSSWVIGSATYASTYVKANSSLEMDGYSVYYVNGLSNKVSILYWSGASGWAILHIYCSENVRTDVKLKYNDYKLYFVGETSGKINILNYSGPGSWFCSPVNSASSVVKTGSKIIVYSNLIYEEGSSTQTFSSANVFYVDVNNKLVYLVYDDTPCSNTHNMLWNTEACKVGGVFQKEWHFGPDANIDVINTVNSNIRIGQNNKDIYFVNSSNQIKLMNRTTPNNTINYNSVSWTPTFSDEFNSLTTTQSKWNPQFPHGDIHQTPDKAHYNDYNNLSFNSGIMNIETKTENTDFYFWRKGFFWNDSCHLKHYDYSSASLHSACYNCNAYHYYTNPYPPTGPLDKLIDCGPTAKPHTFSQKYGWFEMRTKTPRGKGLWDAFWLLPRDYGYSWANEIDVFEIPGNGKYITQTNWTAFVNPSNSSGGRYSHAKIIDCIGYRAYEDYHTYAVKWYSTGIEFYYDNKKVGYTLVDYIPNADEMYMLVNGYTKSTLSTGEMMISSEVEVFPNYWAIDYVRAYTPYVPPRSFSKKESIDNFEVNIFPIPSVDELSIEPIFDGNYNVEIYAIDGKILKLINNLEGTQKIDVSEFQSGVYLFKIINEGRFLYKKITLL